jgi:hypothetical protein
LTDEINNIQVTLWTLLKQSEMNSPPMKHIIFMPYQLRPTLSIIQRSRFSHP